MDAHTRFFAICRSIALQSAVSCTLAIALISASTSQETTRTTLAETTSIATESPLPSPAAEQTAVPTEMPSPTVVPDPTEEPTVPVAEVIDTPTSEPAFDLPAVEPSPSPEDEELASIESGEEHPAAITSTALQASLTYEPAEKPRCAPLDDRPEILAGGGYLDYDCTSAVELHGENVPSSAVQLDWTVLATIGDGWSVQFFPPAADPADPLRWTAEYRDLPGFQHRSGTVDADLAGTTGSFRSTQRINFGVRVLRAACETDSEPVKLDVVVSASLPELDSASVELLGRQAESHELHPEFAPIPKPSLTFGGSLDFGTILVDAFGVKALPAPQTITVTVDGLDQACGAWKLTLKTNQFGDDDGSTGAESLLILATINGEAILDGGCPLNGGCQIANLTAGPSSPPSVIYSLGISLVLPDQVRATTFDSTLTATLSEEAV